MSTRSQDQWVASTPRRKKQRQWERRREYKALVDFLLVMISLFVTIGAFFTTTLFEAFG